MSYEDPQKSSYWADGYQPSARNDSAPSPIADGHAAVPDNDAAFVAVGSCQPPVNGAGAESTNGVAQDAGMPSPIVDGCSQQSAHGVVPATTYGGARQPMRGDAPETAYSFAQQPAYGSAYGGSQQLYGAQQPMHGGAQMPYPTQLPPSFDQPTDAPAPYVIPDQRDNGMATGAMVCGILGLVLCEVPIVGGVLAIIAIILAVVSRRKAGPSGQSTAGLVTGIIGVVIGLLFTLFTAWMMVELVQELDDSTSDSLYGDLFEDWESEFSDEAVSGTFDDPDDQAAYDSAVRTLDIVCKPDEQAKQNLANAVNEGFRAASDMDLEDVGVDPLDIVEWTVADATYEVTSVNTLDDGTGTVFFTSHVHDMDELIGTFTDSVREYRESGEYKNASDEEKKQKLGELMDEAMSEDTQLIECYGTLDMESFGSHWAPSQDSLDRLANDFYGTTWG